MEGFRRFWETLKEMMKRGATTLLYGMQKPSMTRRDSSHRVVFEKFRRKRMASRGIDNYWESAYYRDGEQDNNNKNTKKSAIFLVILRTNTICFIALRFRLNNYLFVGRWMLQMPILFVCELQISVISISMSINIIFFCFNFLLICWCCCYISESTT